jgi:hypothetical protein
VKKGIKMSITKCHFAQHKEIIEEMFSVAQYCITTPRNVGITEAEIGVYGYPAALILLSLISSIGSLFEQKLTVEVECKGKTTEKKIKNAATHIYILNSKYFNQKLKDKELDFIYTNIRSHLVHNCLTPSGHFLIAEGTSEPFAFGYNEKQKISGVTINVKALYELTYNAVTVLNETLTEVSFGDSTVVINTQRKNIDARQPLHGEYSTLTIAASGVVDTNNGVSQTNV